jgi:hypothetical protein
MTLIDLDQPTTAPEPHRPPARPRPALVALALVLAGGVIGGVVVDRWQQQRASDHRRSAVSLVVLPDLLDRPDNSVAATLIVGGQTVAVGVSGHLDVINAGPAPVRFVSLRAAQAGLQLRGDPLPGSGQPIPAGASTIGTIYATVRCDADPLTRLLPVTVEVVTADGVHRRPAITLDGRAWAEKVEATCGQQWSRSLTGRGR